jgi:hypothetical protein
MFLELGAIFVVNMLVLGAIVLGSKLFLAVYSMFLNILSILLTSGSLTSVSYRNNAACPDV